MKQIALLPLALIIAFPVGCRVSEPDPTPDEIDQVRKVGQEACQALLQSLGGQLKAALQAGGPESAMHICQQVAGLSTKAISDNYEGVSVRRTTLKPRNPGNAPDEIDKKVLGLLATSSELPSEHIEWTPDAGRYYKPLVIQEICLKCHGDSSTFSPELKNKLTTLYPDDKATGYGLGELRGAIRVDLQRQ